MDESEKLEWTPPRSVMTGTTFTLDVNNTLKKHGTTLFPDEKERGEREERGWRESWL